MRLGIIRIVIVVVVVGRLIVPEREVAKAGAAHRCIQLACDRQDRVADCFRFELPTVHAPEVLVPAVDRFEGSIARG